MAEYDSADCLVRCRAYAELPEDDESMDDAAWYRNLSAAQKKWYGRIAAINPEVLWGAPTLLQSFDGGATYSFGTDADGRAIIPLGQIALYRTEADASEPEGPTVYGLRPGIHFRHEGDRVRLSSTNPTYLPDSAPWARFITPPSAIDASADPTLLPIEARELIVLDAVVAWCGNLRDPMPFKALIQSLWNGDGAGSPGLLAALRTAWWAHSASRRRPGAGFYRRTS